MQLKRWKRVFVLVALVLFIGWLTNQPVSGLIVSIILFVAKLAVPAKRLQPHEVGFHLLSDIIILTDDVVPIVTPTKDMNELLQHLGFEYRKTRLHYIFKHLGFGRVYRKAVALMLSRGAHISTSLRKSRLFYDHYIGKRAPRLCDTNKFKAVMLKGKPSSGKTVLSKCLGEVLWNHGWIIFYGSSLELNASQAVAKVCDSKSQILIIIDDSHLRPVALLQLIEGFEQKVVQKGMKSIVRVLSVYTETGFAPAFGKDFYLDLRSTTSELYDRVQRHFQNASMEFSPSTEIIQEMADALRIKIDPISLLEDAQGNIVYITYTIIGQAKQTNLGLNDFVLNRLTSEIPGTRETLARGVLGFLAIFSSIECPVTLNHLCAEIKAAFNVSEQEIMDLVELLVSMQRLWMGKIADSPLTFVAIPHHEQAKLILDGTLELLTSRFPTTQNFDVVSEHRAKYLLSDPPNVALYLGSMYTHLTDNALPIYKRACEQNANTPLAWYYLGRAYLKRGDVRKASEAFRNGIEFDPKNPISWSNLGYTLYWQGALDEALTAVKEAARLGPDNWAPWHELFMIHGDLGNLEESMEAAEKAIALDSKGYSSYGMYGFSYGVHGEYEPAMLFLSKHLETYSDDGSIHYFLGLAWKGLEKLDNAERSFRNAIQLDPKKWDCHYQLGLLLIDLGRMREGCRKLLCAWKLADDNQRKLEIESAFRENGCDYVLRS